MTDNFRVDGDTVSFWLKVRPRSARECLAYDSSGELRLDVHAPPSKGEANQACIHFLARALRMPQSYVTIVSGQKSRRKLIRIACQSAKETISAIEAIAGAG
jgi:uncharacterized protein (TIGR00251 family)